MKKIKFLLYIPIEIKINNNIFIYELFTIFKYS